MRTLSIIVTMAFFGLASACSQAPDGMATTAERDGCAISPTASGGYYAECRHGFNYNGKDVGSVLYTHNADPTRSCDDYQSHAQVDGTAEDEPGEVNAILDETTGKISFSVDSAEITILLSDQKNWLWVRSAVAGSTVETDRKVYCPGLEEAAAERAKTVGSADAKSCPGNDQHHVALGEFLCTALEQEISSSEAHKSMSSPNKIHKMAVGKVLVDQAERLAISSSGTKRAAALPVLSVVFSAMGSLFGSKPFQALFDPKTKTDNVTGPVSP